MDLTDKFEEHRPTRERLEAIEDPRQRLKAAAEICNKARFQVVGRPRSPKKPGDVGVPSPLLVDRDAALAVLHDKYDWSKAACGRLADMHRQTVSTTLDGVSQERPDYSEEEALRVAEENHAEWKLQGSIWKSAKAVRDQMVLELVEGMWGDPVPSTEVAEMAQMTAPKVTQIRKPNYRRKRAS